MEQENKMKAKKLSCLILILMLIISGCRKKESESTQKTEVETEVNSAKPVADTTPSKTGGNPAPAFTLQDLNGKTVSLADFKGKVVILDFWATWCPPCIKEIPDFIELYERYKDKGFEMLGISLDQAGISVVQSFAQKNKINYPIMMTDGQVHNAYGGITSIPTTFVIDPAGNIRKKYVGYVEKAVFEADIKKLLEIEK
jgi:peroxiredoxin